MHPNVHCSTIYNSQVMEARKRKYEYFLIKILLGLFAKCPSTDEWIKKMWYIYTMEYYSAIKRNGLGSFCRDVDGSRDFHTE